MNQAFLPEPQELMKIALSRARKQVAGVKVVDKKKLQTTLAIKRIEFVSRTIEAKLTKTVKDFPDVSQLHAFERELLEATIDLDKTKQALGHFTSARRVIHEIQRQEIKRVQRLHKTQGKKAEIIQKSFIGRLSSIVKKLKASIEIYNEAARRMNEFPSIDYTAKTVILAGFPNTGKTTILGRITKSKPRIAEYPFTTQKLQIGYFEAGYEKIQVIDTPGLLDRPIEKRNNIEKKAIAALTHLANAIVFVTDPTETSGYNLEEQLNLLEEIKKIIKAPIIIAINKADIATKEQIEKAKQAARGEIALEGEGMESTLKQKIQEKIGIKKV
ncbi:MAG: 50S ribosome-binding GTPase [Candidatus Diapherotrites archaeon]|nr:50S ribosome-binding GTPase [Candidatus Diapherotrites archaeon]